MPGVRRSTLILAVPLLLVIVALASRPATVASGEGVGMPAWLPIASDTLVQTLLIVVFAGALAATAFNIWAVLPLPRGRPRPRPMRASFAAYLYFAVAIAILVLRARLPRATRPPGAQSGGALGFANPTGLPASQGITWLSILLALIVIAVAVLLLLRWLRPFHARVDLRRDVVLETNAAPKITDALDLSVDDLRHEPDPRRAVIATFARLERVMRAHERPRRASEAPLEYVARILIDLHVSGRAVRRLTDLFEWARFSPHPVGVDMKDEAIAALLEVRSDLARLAPG